MATSPATAGGLTRLGFDPVERQGVAGQQVVKRPLGDETSVVEDRDPVADPLDVGEDVGREDDGRVGPQLGDQGEQVAPPFRVERADRLVEDQQPRPGHERLGDPEALAHAARVAGDPSPGGIGEPDLLERLGGARSRSLRPASPWSRPANSTSSRPVIQP